MSSSHDSVTNWIQAIPAYIYQSKIVSILYGFTLFIEINIGHDMKAAARRSPKFSRKTKNTAKNDFQYGDRSPS